VADMALRRFVEESDDVLLHPWRAHFRRYLNENLDGVGADHEDGIVFRRLDYLEASKAFDGAHLRHEIDLGSCEDGGIDRFLEMKMIHHCGHATNIRRERRSAVLPLVDRIAATASRT